MKTKANKVFKNAHGCENKYNVVAYLYYIRWSITSKYSILFLFIFIYSNIKFHVVWNKNKNLMKNGSLGNVIKKKQFH